MNRFIEYLEVFLAIVLGLMLLAWVVATALEANAQTTAQYLAAKRAIQIQLDEAERLERGASESCRETHGEGAAHWWENGILICARGK